MTLVLTINGPETIWLLADRRLSAKSKPLKDDARKVMFLESTDGSAILGYAGLGATAQRTEPADWMSAVLRGRKSTLELSLGVLAQAMKKQFPAHLSDLSPDHLVMVPAFVDNEARLFTISLAHLQAGTSVKVERWIAPPPARAGSPPRFGMTGSGAMELSRKDKNHIWAREMLRLIRAHDRRQVSALAVADHLAKLNNAVYLRDKLGPVGPRAIVAWRERKGGGAHQLYDLTTRESDSIPLPTIAVGMDLNAIIGVTMPKWTPLEDGFEIGNKDDLNARLSRLPHEPDENLR